MTALACGVIGVGHLGKYHAEKFAAIDGVELVGVADIRADRANEIAAQNGCNAYTDYTELLKCCQAVSIAADTALHYRIAREALIAGVHVLVEKPMTETITQAKDLIDIARTKNLVLQVGHIERYNPAIEKLTTLLREPVFVNCQRIATFVKRTGLEGTDVIIDMMIHDIDLACYLLKDNSPVSIDAIGGSLYTDQIDICDARLVFSRSKTATLTTSRIGRWTNRSVRIYERGICYIADLQAKTLQSIIRDTDVASDVYQLKTTELFCNSENDALFQQINAFIHVIRSARTPLVGGAEGLRALELAARIRESVRIADEYAP